MDELLARRYETLIQNYKTTPVWVKEMVLAKVNQHPTNVRPDATLFLIVNLDEMIVQAYGGHIRPWPFSVIDPPHYGNYTLENLRPKINQALEILFKDLAIVNEVSAHKVLQAIDKNWPQLKILFGWG